MSLSRLLDLAARGLGGSVVAANDEWFAGKENLILPGRPVFDPGAFGPRGKVMDGWETRRRREVGKDWALVRLGAPGVVRQVVVDTAHFTGNHPERAAVQACAVQGYPTPGELAVADWVELVPLSPLKGDCENVFAVALERCFTHVRLVIDPDGGVARLRVLGEVVADPRLLGGSGVDLAAQENGGLALECSDWFYSSPHHLNAPGLPRHMGEGWETRRRRGPGHDWVLLRLAGQGLVERVEVDTSYFLGNAPAECQVLACAVAGGEEPGAQTAWWPLLERTALRPDTRHRFLVAGTTIHPRPSPHPQPWWTAPPEPRGVFTAVPTTQPTRPSTAFTPIRPKTQDNKRFPAIRYSRFQIC